MGRSSASAYWRPAVLTPRPLQATPVSLLARTDHRQPSRVYVCPALDSAEPAPLITRGFLVSQTIEIRVPSTGVKAKWVRIELRKVETLPGAGPDSTFQDFVGPSPVNLWTSPDEYTILRSVCFLLFFFLWNTDPTPNALPARFSFPNPYT